MIIDDYNDIDIRYKTKRRYYKTVAVKIDNKRIFVFYIIVV